MTSWRWWWEGPLSGLRFPLYLGQNPTLGTWVLPVILPLGRWILAPWRGPVCGLGHQAQVWSREWQGTRPVPSGKLDLWAWGALLGSGVLAIGERDLLTSDHVGRGLRDTW